MDKQLFSEYSEAKRLEMLDSNADAVEEMDYIEVLTDDEMRQRKDTLALRSIEESRIVDEKKEAIAGFKERLKPITSEKNQLLEEIKHGSRSVFGRVYKIVEADRVGYYNPKGQLVFERLARPEERQLTIASAKRTGTNE